MKNPVVFIILKTGNEKKGSLPNYFGDALTWFFTTSWSD